jgi:hypothetical protein
MHWPFRLGVFPGRCGSHFSETCRSSVRRCSATKLCVARRSKKMSPKMLSRIGQTKKAFTISESERYVFIAHIFSFRRRQTVARFWSRIWFPPVAVQCSVIYAMYALDAKAAIFRRARRPLPALAAILIPASVLSKKSAMLSRFASE